MEKAKENLKERILKAFASGDVAKMEDLKFEVWAHKPAKETFKDPKFQEWLKSDEAKNIRAHLDAEY